MTDGEAGGEIYRESVAWQKAMELAALVYRGDTEFPSDERFGLTNQLRRAAVSVASNIAEGKGRIRAVLLMLCRWKHCRMPVFLRKTGANVYPLPEHLQKNCFSRGELIQFLGMARGSALEVQTQIEIAVMLKFGDPEELLRMQAVASEVMEILNASLTTMRGRVAPGNVR